MTGNIEAISGYSLHPLHERDPDFPNHNSRQDADLDTSGDAPAYDPPLSFYNSRHNTFTGARYWTLSFTVKFLFGN